MKSLFLNEYSFDHTGCWRLAYKPIYRSPNHLVYSLISTSKDYISEVFMFSSLLYSYIFCHIQCAKTALQKLVKSEALKVTVYRVYTDWHMLILINSQVFVSFFSSFFFSLTPLHLRILYFPNAINCDFFLKTNS